MGQTDRLYQLKNWFDSGRCLSRDFFLSQLEVSHSTLKRDLALLRDRLNAPVVFEKERRGWMLDPSIQLAGTQYELPGLWLSSDEMQALLTMQHLLANLDTGGLLGPHIEPLMKRLTQLLGKGTQGAADLARRIRVQTVGARQLNLPHFQAVGSALLQRRRLVIHYRDNWYLDAWCHLRRGLRNFALDAISQAHLLERPAKEVDEATLDATFAPSYGIFSGGPVQWARLHFTPGRARWVAHEQWHPQQQGQLQADGSYLLRLPYADHRELMMDILKHGAHCEVLGPAGLRRAVGEEVGAMAQKYLNGQE